MSLKEYYSSHKKQCSVCSLWKERSDLKKEIIDALQSVDPPPNSIIAAYLTEQGFPVTTDTVRNHVRNAHDYVG